MEIMDKNENVTHGQMSETTLENVGALRLKFNHPYTMKLYGIRHMVKDHSDSERGNPLLPHGLLLPTSSKTTWADLSPTHGRSRNMMNDCLTSHVVNDNQVALKTRNDNITTSSASTSSDVVDNRITLETGPVIKLSLNTNRKTLDRHTSKSHDRHVSTLPKQSTRKIKNYATWKDLSPSKDGTGGGVEDKMSCSCGSYPREGTFTTQDGRKKELVTWKDVSPPLSPTKMVIKAGLGTKLTDSSASSAGVVKRSPERKGRHRRRPESGYYSNDVQGESREGIDSSLSGSDIANQTKSGMASSPEDACNEYYYDEDFIVQFDTNIRDGSVPPELSDPEMSSLPFPHSLTGSYTRFGPLQDSFGQTNMFVGHYESELSGSRTSMEISSSEREMMCSSDMLDFSNDPLFTPTPTSDVVTTHFSVDSLGHAAGVGGLMENSRSADLGVDCCPRKEEYFLSFDTSQGRSSASLSEHSYASQTSASTSQDDAQTTQIGLSGGSGSATEDNEDVCSSSFHYCHHARRPAGQRLLEGHGSPGQRSQGQRSQHRGRASSMGALPERSLEKSSLSDVEKGQRSCISRGSRSLDRSGTSSLGSRSSSSGRRSSASAADMHYSDEVNAARRSNNNNNKQRNITSWKRVKNLQKFGILENMLNTELYNSLPDFSAEDEVHNKRARRRFNEDLQSMADSFHNKRHSASLLEMYQRMKSESNPVSPNTMNTVECVMFPQNRMSDDEKLSVSRSGLNTCCDSEECCCGKRGMKLDLGHKHESNGHRVGANQFNSGSRTMSPSRRTWGNKSTSVSPDTLVLWHGTRNFAAQFPPKTRDCGIQTSACDDGEADTLLLDHSMQTSPNSPQHDFLSVFNDICGHQSRPPHKTESASRKRECVSEYRERKVVQVATNVKRSKSLSPSRMGRNLFYTYQSLPDLSFLASPRFDEEFSPQSSLFDPVKIPIILTPVVDDSKQTQSRDGSDCSCSCQKEKKRNRAHEIASSSSGFSTSSSSGIDPGYCDTRRCTSLAADLERLLFLPPHLESNPKYSGAHNKGGIPSSRSEGFRQTPSRLHQRAANNELNYCRCETCSSRRESDFGRYEHEIGRREHELGRHEHEMSRRENEIGRREFDITRRDYDVGQYVTDHGLPDCELDRCSSEISRREHDLSRREYEMSRRRLEADVCRREIQTGRRLSNSTSSSSSSFHLEGLYALKEASPTTEHADSRSDRLLRQHSETYLDELKLNYQQMDHDCDDTESLMDQIYKQLNRNKKPLKSCLRKKRDFKARSLSIPENFDVNGEPRPPKKPSRYSIACDGVFPQLVSDEHFENANIQLPFPDQQQEKIFPINEDVMIASSSSSSFEEGNFAKKSVSFASEVSFHSPQYSPKLLNKGGVTQTVSSLDLQDESLTLEILEPHDEDAAELNTLINVSPQTSAEFVGKLIDQDITTETVRKRSILLCVTQAAESLVEHFAQARDPFDKLRLGSSAENPKIATLVVTQLCPALEMVVEEGMKPYLMGFHVFGKIHITPWRVAEMSSELGPYTRAVNELVRKLKLRSSLVTNKQKFFAFIVGLANLRLLDFWMGYVRSKKDIVGRVYEDDSILSLSETTLRHHYDNMLLALQPLAVLPFQLEFEIVCPSNSSSETSLESHQLAQSLELKRPAKEQHEVLEKCQDQRSEKGHAQRSEKSQGHRLENDCQVSENPQPIPERRLSLERGQGQVLEKGQESPKGQGQSWSWFGGATFPRTKRLLSGFNTAKAEDKLNKSVKNGESSRPRLNSLDKVFSPKLTKDLENFEVKEKLSKAGEKPIDGGRSPVSSFTNLAQKFLQRTQSQESATRNLASASCTASKSANTRRQSVDSLTNGGNQSAPSQSFSLISFFDKLLLPEKQAKNQRSSWTEDTQTADGIDRFHGDARGAGVPAELHGSASSSDSERSLDVLEDKDVACEKIEGATASKIGHAEPVKGKQGQVGRLEEEKENVYPEYFLEPRLECERTMLDFETSDSPSEESSIQLEADVSGRFADVNDRLAVCLGKKAGGKLNVSDTKDTFLDESSQEDEAGGGEGLASSPPISDGLTNISPISDTLTNSAPISEDLADCPQLSSDLTSNPPIGDDLTSSQPIGDGITSSPIGDGVTSSPTVSDGVTTNHPISDDLTSSQPIGDGVTSSPIGDGVTTNPPISDDLTSSQLIGDGVTSSPPIGDGVATSPPIAEGFTSSRGVRNLDVDSLTGVDINANSPSFQHDTYAIVVPTPMNNGLQTKPRMEFKTFHPQLASFRPSPTHSSQLLPGDNQSEVPTQHSTVPSSESEKLLDGDEKPVLEATDIRKDSFGMTSFKHAMTLVAHESSDPDELSFEHGDYLEVLAQLDRDWLYCANGKHEGRVKVTEVRQMSDEETFEKLHNNFYY